MKQERTNEYCLMCRNYCHLSNPVCGRVRNFTEFIETPSHEGGTKEPDKDATESKSRLMMLFQKCVHMLHHRKEHQ